MSYILSVAVTEGQTGGNYVFARRQNYWHRKVYKEGDTEINNHVF